MEKITVLGDGGWGTALALLSNRKGREVTLWGAFPDYMEEVSRTRLNRKFLPGIVIPPDLTLTADPERALAEAGTVILAVPSQFMRGVCRGIKDYLPSGCLLVSAAKGLETDSLKRMSQVIGEILPGRPLVVLSGPSHAEEVARSLPTTVVAAAEEEDYSRRVQSLLMTERFRVYTHDDLVGVEVGGATKNVIAIAAGICDGLKFGDNTKAALLTRGMVEISRLGAAMGAPAETFWGLSGIGDLIATSFSPFGRNLRLGRMIGEGKTLDEALSTSEMVVEGVKSARAAYLLGERYGVELPITGEIYRVLYENKSPLEAVTALMTRLPKAERV